MIGSALDSKKKKEKKQHNYFNGAFRQSQEVKVIGVSFDYHCVISNKQNVIEKLFLKLLLCEWPFQVTITEKCKAALLGGICSWCADSKQQQASPKKSRSILLNRLLKTYSHINSFYAVNIIQCRKAVVLFPSFEPWIICFTWGGRLVKIIDAAVIIYERRFALQQSRWFTQR